MGNWSKVRIFFLLILLIGTILHLFVNLLYFSLYQEQVTGGYYSIIFLISLSFIIFSTFIFCKKISGFMARTFGATVILLFQTFLFILTFAPFAVLDSMSEFLTPKFIQGDQRFGHSVEARFFDKYGIDIAGDNVINHSSYWQIGEEFGYDLIININGDVSSNYAPKEIDFNLLKGNTNNTPFRFSNLQFLCKNTMGSNLIISDEKIFDLLCSEKEFPDDTLIAEKKVREDWTITSVLFPSNGILWITETEW